MGVTTQDIFGGTSGAQPALPGTYGEAPSTYRLPMATTLGGVVLQVADLSRSLAFYELVLGLRVLSNANGVATLAPHGTNRVLVELRERKGAKPVAGKGRLGLYHFAILLPNRAALGMFVRHLSEIGARAGAGDHLVSEAFYLNDPDGLGIEVYYDRPRETWMRMDRELMMATDPVDVAGLVEHAGNARWAGMPQGTVMGHVHLHVGDVNRAWQFYGEGVGFDKIVWHYPGALFMAAGGYHHHLGTNTWAGPGAPSAAEDEAKLVEWTIELPSVDDVNAVAESVARVRFTATRDGDDAVLRDPWGTQVRVRVRA